MTLRVFAALVALLWPTLTLAQSPRSAPTHRSAAAPVSMTRPASGGGALATVQIFPGQDKAVPGGEFTAVLQITHQPSYHSYWRNWGSAGASPKIRWALPEGVGTSEIDYAVPHPIVTSGLPGYGYEGTIQHLLHFTIPASVPPGTNLSVEGSVNLLVCNDSACVPVMPAPVLKLTIPVAEAGAATGPPSDPAAVAALEAARAHQPETPDWPATWAIEGSELVYTVETPDAASAQALAASQFFSGETSATASRTDLGQPAKLSAEGNRVSARAILSTGTVKDGVGELKSWQALFVDPTSSKALEFSASRAGNAAPTASASATGSSHSASTNPSAPLPLPQILAFALLGGLILNIMPCVFPVLGLKVMHVVSQAGGARRQIVLHGLAYTAGVLVFFWLLAGLLLGLKASGMELGNGFQLQNRFVVYALVFIVFVIALNLVGLFEIGTSLTTAGQNLQHKSGLLGSFFTGALATIVATPCTAPFLGTALGAALQLPPAGIVASFTAMGLGLALPFLLLSAFPALVEKLPRPGAWMESFKIFMGFLMFGAAGFLLFNYAWVVKAGSASFLGRYLPYDAFLAIILALTAVAVAAWIYGRWGQQRRGSSRLVGIIGAALLFLGAVVAASPVESVIKWENWSPEREAELVANKTPYFIDFTATWCATCQTNKATYVGNPTVGRLVNAKGIVMLKADWTDQNDDITLRLRELGRASVPTNILWHAGQPTPELFPDTWTSASTVIERFEKVP